MGKFSSLPKRAWRLLWGADAGRRAFFSLLLATFGTWTLLAVFTLADGWASVMNWLWGCVFGGSKATDIFPWPGIYLLLPVVLWAYFIVMTMRLWRTVSKPKLLWRITAAVLALAAVAAVALDVLPLSALWSIPLLILPLLIYHKQWKLVLLRGAVWGVTLFAAGRALRDLGVIRTMMVHIGEPFSCTPPAVPWPETYLSALAIAGLGLWPLGTWLTAKLVAGTTGRPWRSFFGRGEVALLVLFGATYVLSLNLALAEERRTERSIAELSAFHKVPAMPQTLHKLYFAGQRPDGEFWKRAIELDGNAAPPEKEPPIADSPGEEFPPEKLDKIRRKLESLPDLKPLEAMFSSPLPPNVRDYGDILGIVMPELRVMRNICLYEAWRIRFAVADGDAKTALAALRRMEFVSDRLANDNFMTPQIVRHAVDDWRLGALERMLDAKMLPADEIRRQKERLENELGDPRRRHRQCALAEAVSLFQICDRIAHGGIDMDYVLTEAFYPFRWLFPPLWYIFSCNRGEVARFYAMDDLTQVELPRRTSSKSQLRDMFMPALKLSGGRFDKLAARQEKLLKALDGAGAR